MAESKYIKFTDERPSLSGKTKIWIIRTKEGNAVLGTIKWFANWRYYGFYPESETVFEQQCLRDIANFCEEQTKLQKAKS